MIALLAALAAVPAPVRLQVATREGVHVIPLAQFRNDGPMVPLQQLALALGATISTDSSWVTLQTPAGRFRFLPGTPVMIDGVSVRGLPGSTLTQGDSVYVPLAFVAEVLGDTARHAWVWDARSTALTQATMTFATTPRAVPPPAPKPPANTLPNGLRPGHVVTIDAGHGGTDPGNPGMYFPRGLKEKDVTLAVSLLVRDELRRQGVKVIMTRTRDTLINLGERAPNYCKGDCDIFVSIHVNSLNPRPGYTLVRGFETYFLSEARNADDSRLARIENAAVKYDVADASPAPSSALDFMFKDLTNNEYLRESQRAAALIQSSLQEVHDITDRSGVKQANFAVLRTARRPSVLVEIGFATNREDAALMTTSSGQHELAAAIGRAIVLYLRNHDLETSDINPGDDQ